MPIVTSQESSLKLEEGIFYVQFHYNYMGFKIEKKYHCFPLLLSFKLSKTKHKV